jgi:hypothetical protein
MQVGRTVSLSKTSSTATSVPAMPARRAGGWPGPAHPRWPFALEQAHVSAEGTLHPQAPILQPPSRTGSPASHPCWPPRRPGIDHERCRLRRRRRYCCRRPIAPGPDRSQPTPPPAGRPHKVPDSPMLGVETSSVVPVDMPHPLRQSPLRCADEQVGPLPLPTLSPMADDMTAHPR